MSDRIIGNNEKDAGWNEGNFTYLIHVLPLIFLPEDLMSQHIISVLQSVESSCIANPVQMVISAY